MCVCVCVRVRACVCVCELGKQRHTQTDRHTHTLSLQYVEDWRFDRSQVDGMSILHQAVKGLNHLHSIGIGEPINLTSNQSDECIGVTSYVHR